VHCARGRRLPTIVRGYEPLDGEVPAKPIPRRWPLWLQLSALLCSGFSGLRWRLRSRRSTSYRTRGCGFIVAGTHTALFQPPTPVHNAIASRLLGFNCFHIFSLENFRGLKRVRPCTSDPATRLSTWDLLG